MAKAKRSLTGVAGLSDSSSAGAEARRSAAGLLEAPGLSTKDNCKRSSGRVPGAALVAGTTPRKPPRCRNWSMGMDTRPINDGATPGSSLKSSKTNESPGASLLSSPRKFQVGDMLSLIVGVCNFVSGRLATEAMQYELDLLPGDKLLRTPDAPMMEISSFLVATGSAVFIMRFQSARVITASALRCKWSDKALMVCRKEATSACAALRSLPKPWSSCF
mmetsp:Transcript_45796/g.132123  ORF Transcript_45796/g.132123 Transcript_45796/m.132123 type:complete len:219 (+) Transcript_45796:1817-2473(+)